MKKRFSFIREKHFIHRKCLDIPCPVPYDDSLSVCCIKSVRILKIMEASIQKLVHHDEECHLNLKDAQGF